MNNASQYNDTSISASASGNNVANNPLVNESVYARWSFEEIATSTFNNYYAGDYIGQGAHINIKVSADSSIYQNNYVTQTNINYVNIWNGISSNITIYDLDDVVPASVTPFSVEYRGYTPANLLTTYGRTQGYKKVLFWYEEASLNEDFDKVEISINTSNRGPFAISNNAYLLEKVIAHELGHALKLAHPMEQNDLQPVTNARNNYASNSSVFALMNQGDPAVASNLTASTPKWHDIINLRNKWGA